MLLDALHDELDLIMDVCTVQELAKLKATSKVLGASARRALGAPRFQERRRLAPLGAALLRAHQEGAEWFKEARSPSRCTWAWADVRQQVDELLSTSAWSSEGRELTVGMWVRAHSWSNQLGQRAFHEGLLHRVDRVESTCEVLEFAGVVFLHEDDEELVKRTYPLSEVKPLFPADLAAGVLAIQDWHPRAFAYLMLRFDRENDLNVGRAERPLDQVLAVDLEGSLDAGITVEESALEVILTAVGNWEPDVNPKGLAQWLGATLKLRQDGVQYHFTGSFPEDIQLKNAFRLMDRLFERDITLSEEGWVRIFCTFHSGLVWQACRDGMDAAHGELPYNGTVCDLHKKFLEHFLSMGLMWDDNARLERILLRSLRWCADPMSAFHCEGNWLGGPGWPTRDTDESRTVVRTLWNGANGLSTGHPWFKLTDEAVSEAAAMIAAVITALDASIDWVLDGLLGMRTLLDPRPVTCGGAGADRKIEWMSYFLGGLFSKESEDGRHPPAKLMDWIGRRVLHLSAGRYTRHGITLTEMACAVRQTWVQADMQAVVARIATWPVEWNADHIKKAAQFIWDWNNKGSSMETHRELKAALVQPWWPSDAEGADARKRALLENVRALIRSAREVERLQ